MASECKDPELLGFANAHLLFSKKDGMCFDVYNGEINTLSFALAEDLYDLKTD